MSANPPHRLALRVIPRGARERPSKIFCGHCGRAPETRAAKSRVCPTCGLGLLLEASVDVAPSPRDPFLVIDSTLMVCAVSREAERLLGVSETDAVNHHVGDFLSPGDSESGADSLITALALTTQHDAPIKNLVVRPTNTFGVRYWARIGRCGPPSAALLVLADAR
jgi:PAS domain-containing protein